jgi:hypothetical protein
VKPSSAYKSYDKKLQEAMMKKQLEQQMAEQKGKRQRMNFKDNRWQADNKCRILPVCRLQNKFMRKETLITPYLMKSPYR